MLSVVKIGSKMAVVGTAVYVTVDNSVWDKSDYAKEAITKVKTSLPETTELLKNVPSSNTLADKWNKGVESVFHGISNSGQVVSDSSKKAMSYVAGKNEN